MHEFLPLKRQVTHIPTLLGKNKVTEGRCLSLWLWSLWWGRVGVFVFFVLSFSFSSVSFSCRSACRVSFVRWAVVCLCLCVVTCFYFNTISL